MWWQRGSEVFRLVLRYRLERPGPVVTRPQLLTDVWACTYTGDGRTVNVHISRLRRKLPSLRACLTTVKNVGYRLDGPEDARVADGQAAERVERVEQHGPAQDAAACDEP